MKRQHYVDPQRACEVLRAVLDLHRSDSVYVSGRTIREVSADRGIVVSCGPPDSRRNANPLDLRSKTRWCFADEDRSDDWGIDVTAPDRRVYYYRDFTDFSGMCLETTTGKALQYACRCEPEPSAEHFADMLDIARCLDERALTIVNLPGTGASVPQNFHTQIVPLRYWKDGRPQPDTVATQLRNIQTFGEPLLPVNNVRISVVTLPVFGLVLDFSEFSSDPEQIAEKLFAAVHQSVRYGSQLFLSYNLYIQNRCKQPPGQSSEQESTEPPDWRRVTVLFRESRLERICATQEMYDLVEKRAGRAKAEAIRCSDNRHWRWGWWEMVGGLWARDGSFDGDRFDEQFWRSVYDLLTVKDYHRSRILERVTESLK